MSEARRFGRYRVTGTLGAGAMGEVHAAVDEVLGREVAVKTLRSHANGLAARMLDDRFRQEARAIAALSHPGVVQVYDIDLTADPPYLVMERVAGPSLKEQIDRGGALSPNELRALGIQIGRALAAAHAQKIVHRDVKPANILAAGAGMWKLADFGVAHVPDSSLTMTGQFVGSPAYAPPEALVRGQCDVEGDVFGLGASLYHAAAGRWPRLEATTGGLLAPVAPIHSLEPELPHDIAAIIDRALSVEPALRPTAGELADALAGAREPASTIASQPASAIASQPASAIASQPASALSFPGSSPASSSPLPIASPAHAGHGATGHGATGHDATGHSTGHSSGHGATVPLATTPVPLPSPPPQPSTPVRWKPWALGGSALLVLGLVAGRCSAPSSSSPSSLSSPVPPASLPSARALPGPASSTLPGPERAALGPRADAIPPGTLRVVAPPMHGAKAARDWDRILEHIERGDLRGAKRKLKEWERKHADGPTPETQALRAQLEALGPERGPRDDDD